MSTKPCLDVKKHAKDLLEQVRAVVAAMDHWGSREQVETIGGPIRVEHVTRDPLNTITPQDIYREGFPHLTKAEFIRMFKASHAGCRVATVVTRIEFSYESIPPPAREETGP